MTYQDALQFGRSALIKHTCAGADADRDALLLLSVAAGVPKETIMTHPERRLGFFRSVVFRGMMRRRSRHIPIAHIIGTAWFYGREFIVDSHTLVPRPATEALIDIAKTIVNSHPNLTIIDVGTGSGCIAVTMAAETGKPIIATDTSPHALHTAEKNALRNDVAERISFRNDDLIALTRSTLNAGSHVAIIANLPYIPTGDIPMLDPCVREHEPRAALDGGADGLDPSRALIDQIAEWKNRPPADIILELLPEQVDPIIVYTLKRLPHTTARPIAGPTETIVGVHMHIAV